MNSQDELYWQWNKGQAFTIKFVYEMLNDRGARDALPATIWSLRILKKVKIFIWIVLKEIISTVDNLSKRGWTSNQFCVLCAYA